MIKEHETYALGELQNLPLHHDQFQTWRQAALQKFSGVPTRKDENYKYLRLDYLQQQRWQMLDADTSMHSLETLALENIEITVLPTGIKTTGLPEGVVCQPIMDAALTEADIATTDKHSAFRHINSALFHSGFVLEIAAHTVVKQPIVVHYLLPDCDAASMQHLRIKVRMAAGSQATIIENFSMAPLQTDFFETIMTDVELAAGAKLDWIKLQNRPNTVSHIAELHCRQQRDSCFVQHQLALGAKLSRHDVHSELLEPAAETVLHGVYLPQAGQVHDAHLLVEHLTDHCQSLQNYRGIVAEKAQAVFNGKTIVHAGTKQNRAEQNNANLLLADNAEVDAKPELEIYADDVVCSHGCTIGGLDEAALFYMQSRGIPLKTAKQLLMRGFVSEIAASISNETIGKLMNTQVLKKI